MRNSKAAIRHPLKLLLLQPDPARSEELVAQLSDAGFEVTAEVEGSIEGFEDRLCSGRYDLAINSLLLARRVHFPDHKPKLADRTLGIMSLDLNGNVKMWNQGCRADVWLDRAGDPRQSIAYRSRERARRIPAASWIRSFMAHRTWACACGASEKTGNSSMSDFGRSHCTMQRAEINGNVAILADLTSEAAVESGSTAIWRLVRRKRASKFTRSGVSANCWRRRPTRFWKWTREAKSCS